MKEEVQSSLPPITKLKRWQWRFLVFLNICFLLVGHGAAILLLRFYYDHGGRSKWMPTLAQNAGFPILFIPFILFPSIKEPPKSPTIIVFSLYFALAALITADKLLYSVGLASLSPSIYSIICATQLPFTAVFSLFINSHKFTILILNSVVVLSLSAFLVAIKDDSSTGTPPAVGSSKYALGVVATLGASVLYALLLSLTQVSLEKVIKKETFAVVLEVQIYTSMMASCVSLAGLFGSGEWRTLRDEVASFHAGSLSYAMTLAWTAVAWQVCSVGAVGLIFVVSALFSNVISTLSLCLSPLVGAIAFHYPMSGGKVIGVILGIWGFWSYVYHNSVDDDVKNKRVDGQKCPQCSC